MKLALDRMGSAAVGGSFVTYFPTVGFVGESPWPGGML